MPIWTYGMVNKQMAYTHYKQNHSRFGILRTYPASFCDDGDGASCLNTVRDGSASRASLEQKANHTNSEIHSHNTRGKNDLFILPYNTSLCKNNFNNIGIRKLNQLPLSIIEIPVLYKFKRTLKAFLLHQCFYSIGEFLFFGAYPSYIKHKDRKSIVEL
jgi:hypothetical protein